MAILETKDLRKIYGSGENEVRALDGVSISVEEGEFVAVIGTSGSGKSTLLNMIGGLDRPTSGSVTIRGKELLKMKDEELTIFRRRNIGFVFQNYNLLPVLNVYENIVYPIEIDGGKTDTGFVKEIIQTLGLERKLKICRTISLAVSSRGLRLPVRLQQSLPLSLPTSRLEIWTQKQVWM